MSMKRSSREQRTEAELFREEQWFVAPVGGVHVANQYRVEHTPESLRALDEKLRTLFEKNVLAGHDAATDTTVAIVENS
jgi:hypothetical protein